MRRRPATAIAMVVSTTVALVLAHDLAFLARYGSAFGEALAHAGHGPAWTGAVAGSLAIGAGLLVAAILGLRRLGLVAEHLRARGISSEPRWRAFLRSWATWAAALASITTVVLTIQENIERMTSGIATPNAALLLSVEYPWAIPIVIVVALAVAFVMAVVAWRRDVLEARIRLARARQIRVSSVPQPVVRAERPLAVVRGLIGLRAPPPSGIAAPA